MISLPALFTVSASVLGLVLIVAALIRLWRRGRTADHVKSVANKASVVEHAVQHAQRRAVVAVVFSIAMFVAISSVAFAAPQFLGIPLAAAPGLAVSGGLLLFAVTPPALVPKRERNSALLRSRRPWSFGSKWSFFLPLAVATGLIIFLTWAGVTSSPDARGLYRAISVSDDATSSTASPYPGWFYGVPLIVVTVVLAISTVLALVRISSTPSLPAAELGHLDQHWRNISTRVITKLSTAAMLGYFGGAAFIAGQATHNVATSRGTNGYVLRQPEFVIGATLLVAGGVLAIAALVFLILAAFDAATLRTAALRAWRGDLQAGSA